MLKTVLSFTIIFFCVFQIKAQTNPADNKNIGLCNMYGDTLKLDDLKACTTVTIRSDKPTTVTSFMFSYYLSDKMNVKLINIFGNSIKKEELDELIKIKPKKIFIQDVIGESDSEILTIGHRTIYIK